MRDNWSVLCQAQKLPLPMDDLTLLGTSHINIIPYCTVISLVTVRNFVPFTREAPSALPASSSSFPGMAAPRPKSTPLQGTTLPTASWCPSSATCNLSGSPSWHWTLPGSSTRNWGRRGRSRYRGYTSADVMMIFHSLYNLIVIIKHLSVHQRRVVTSRLVISKGTHCT